jgi:hypothetical protein
MNHHNRQLQKDCSRCPNARMCKSTQTMGKKNSPPQRLLQHWQMLLQMPRKKLQLLWQPQQQLHPKHIQKC